MQAAVTDQADAGVSGVDLDALFLVTGPRQRRTYSPPASGRRFPGVSWNTPMEDVIESLGLTEEQIQWRGLVQETETASL